MVLGTLILLLFGAIGLAQERKLTPSQQEGPYYPVEKPADRDSDLLLVDGGRQAAGDVLLLSGRVLRPSGEPMEGAVVEIWQTDAQGVYLHPRDPDYEARDGRFQGYGEAVTGSHGRYEFRTLLPGQYGRRPPHIHLKVRYQGRELLTTQFYFGNYPGSGRGPRTPAPIILVLTRQGSDTYSAEGDLVVRTQDN